MLPDQVLSLTHNAAASRVIAGPTNRRWCWCQYNLVYSLGDCLEQFGSQGLICGMYQVWCVDLLNFRLFVPIVVRGMIPACASRSRPCIGQKCGRVVGWSFVVRIELVPR